MAANEVPVNKEGAVTSVALLMVIRELHSRTFARCILKLLRMEIPSDYWKNELNQLKQVDQHFTTIHVVVSLALQ
jgi:hypothetical protein